MLDALLIAVVLGTDPPDAPQDAPPDAPPGPGASAAPARIHLDLGLDVTSAYYFRGLLQERDEVMVQPWIEISGDLTSAEATVDVSVFAGLWNSIHSVATDAETSNRIKQYWYELDWYAGLSFGVDDFSLTATYYLYTSPSDAFDQIEELELVLAYDDAAAWDGGFSLNPETRIAIETGSEAGDGNDPGTALELALTPTIDLTGEERLYLSVPLNVGLDVDDYYTDESGDSSTFAYFEVGLEAALELPGSGRGGTWTLSGGVHWITFGTAVTEINDRQDDVFARIGLSGSY